LHAHERTRTRMHTQSHNMYTDNVVHICSIRRGRYGHICIPRDTHCPGTEVNDSIKFSLIVYGSTE
jgi:hypothetical protein